MWVAVYFAVVVVVGRRRLRVVRRERDRQRRRRVAVGRRASVRLRRCPCSSRRLDVLRLAVARQGAGRRRDDGFASASASSARVREPLAAPKMIAVRADCCAIRRRRPPTLSGAAAARRRLQRGRVDRHARASSRAKASARCTRCRTARRSRRSSTFAPQIAAKIAQIERDTGASQVVIVAHSMGGLVARSYLRAVRRRRTCGGSSRSARRTTAACTRG